jgi:hypothetical protein
MNLYHLAKFYDRLTPLERLPLIIAAGARGDKVEQERLNASAPKQTFEVPHHLGLTRALRQAVDFHAVTLLDLAANFWQWWGLWMIHALRERGAGGANRGSDHKAKTDKASETRAGGLACYYASRFVAHVDGWKQFCRELHLDPEVQLRFMPGWDIIQRTEAQTRELALSPEEAAKFVATQTLTVDGNDCLERGPVPVESADQLAEAWHQILDKLAQEC